METQLYFTMQKYNPLKETKNPSRYYYYNSIITNFSSFQHKPKYIMFKKSSYKNKIDLLFIISLGAYKNPLSYYYTL